MPKFANGLQTTHNMHIDGDVIHGDVGWTSIINRSITFTWYGVVQLRMGPSRVLN